MSSRIQILITPRQLEMVALLASGYSYSEIGEMKFVSPHTVRNIVHAARDRVGARNVTHLAVICMDHGLLSRTGLRYNPVQAEGVIG